MAGVAVAVIVLLGVDVTVTVLVGTTVAVNDTVGVAEMGMVGVIDGAGLGKEVVLKRR